jgi:hypothetical protein
MGRSPTGPEDLLALMLVVAFVVALTPRRFYKLKLPYAVPLLLLRGFSIFAFFFFVRSERIAYWDGTNWTTVRHGYFRASLAVFIVVCSDFVRHWLKHEHEKHTTSIVMQVAQIGVLVWVVVECGLIPLKISKDQIYLAIAAAVNAALCGAKTLYELGLLPCDLEYYKPHRLRNYARSLTSDDD